MILLKTSGMKKYITSNSSVPAPEAKEFRAMGGAGSRSIFDKMKYLLCLIALMPAAAANATTWYVDNTASGAKNGTSWANAWTSLSSVSGVKAGDTVYISGGPSGSSQTYSTGTWAPAGGSASGGIITYQIGQDSQHNGTAIFNCSGTFITLSSYLAVVGDAGDGQMHFAVTGCNTMAWQYNGPTHDRIAYVNFGQVTGNGANPEDWIFLDPVSAFEFDHNYVYMTSPTANAYAYFQFQDSTWDGSKIHNNTIYTPHATGDPGQGADGIEAGSATGYSIYNNLFVSYGNNYTGGQHADGWQDTGGSSYIKIYNNTYMNYGNFCLYGDPTFGPMSYVYVYNNIVMDSDPNVQAGSSGGIIFGTDGGLNTGSTSFSYIVIANNIAVDFLTRQAAFALNNHTSFPTTFNNCVMANNIAVNSSAVQNGYDMNGNNSTPLVDCISITAAQAASMFTKYVVNGGLNNNFNLTSAATPIIGQGVNESTYFTVDANGNVRPSSGAWDLGPYIYGSGSSGPLFVVSPISASGTDVDPNTAGLQVYEGTTVQFSSGVTYTGSSAVNWQWSYSVNGGASVVYQSGSGTVPAISFAFGTGSGGNTYVWTLSATAGTNSGSASMTMSVETPPAPNTSLTFQATSGVLTAPMVATGNYISQPVQSTVISATGEALYTCTITNAGNYVIQAMVNAPGDSANSFYLNIDAQPVDPTMCWDIFPFTTNFQSRIVSWRGNGSDTNNQYVPKVFNLATGTHQIIIAGREANTQLQSFSLIQLPSTPQNLHVMPTVVNAPTFSAGP
jgi:hypothetical protein